MQKRKESKLIIFNKPKCRYVGDLTEIPFELRLNTKYIYIFTIIDRFSKLSNSYLLIDKTKESILENLKKFFLFFGFPEEFGCDNDREFVNIAVENYLHMNSIKIIHGAPIHLTLKESLREYMLQLEKLY